MLTRVTQLTTPVLSTVGQSASETVGGILGGGTTPPPAGLLPTLLPIVGGVVRSVAGVSPLMAPKALVQPLPTGGRSGTTGNPASPAGEAGPGDAAGSPSDVAGSPIPIAQLLSQAASVIAHFQAGMLPSGPFGPSGLLNAIFGSAMGSWAAVAYTHDNGTPPARSVPTPQPVPLPAPPPGVGFPSSAGEGPGYGFSIFLTLAALLVLGAPLTRRRTRLAGRPRWPAPFVLIPDTRG